MMEDKKRKKFGLSLKNAKKLAVTKSEVKEQRSAEASASRNPKEQKNVRVLGAGRSSCVVECGLKRKLKPSVNTLGKESPVLVDNEEERERMLWKNLFSVNSSANWETMEDLPISNVSAHTSGNQYEASKSIRMEKEGSMKIEDNKTTISSSLTQDFKANQEMDTFNIDLDYKDLPKPCIACYTKKPCLLTWSQDDDDKIMKESDINDISPSPKASTLDINTSSIKRSSQNNFSSPTLFQKKSDVLKCQRNGSKPAALFNQNMKRKESILQNNINKNQTIKMNAGRLFQSSEGKNSQDATNNASDLTTTNKVIDLTSDDSQQKPDNRGRIGKSLDFTSTKEKTIYKQNNYVFHKSPSGLVNVDLKAKSEKLNLTVGDSGAKRNVEAVKKEILKCCPICQFQFPQRMNKQGIDQHISSCIGNEELFIDDDEEDW